MLPSPAALVEALRSCNLLDSAQLGQVARLATSFRDAKALAGELIRRGVLTPFQANLLLQDRSPELTVGAYVLIEKVGEGGMGHVFKARHAQLGRIVALKLIRKERLAHPQAIKRFYREIKVAAKLEHPNIVRAIDADEVNGAYFLIMEYVDGIDLARWVKQHGPLPADLACEFIRQAALGLQHAYECGMVHRDIKPANLLVGALPTAAPAGSPSGSGLRRSPMTAPPAAAAVAPSTSVGAYQVKILDMGLARSIESTDEEETTSLLTREGTVMGTADYMAPEQAVASHEVDIRADLYSLGCTLYLLLTGRVPFPGGTMAQKLLCHQSNEPTSLEELCPDISASVAAVVRTLMAKQREDRFQTPAELAQALADIAQGKTVSVRRPVVVEHIEDTALADTNPFADLGTDEEPPKPLPAAKPILPRATPSNERRQMLVVAVIAAALIVLVLLAWGIIAWNRSAGRARAGDDGQPPARQDKPAGPGDPAALAAKAHEQRCAAAEAALTTLAARPAAALTAEQLLALRQDIQRFLTNHSGTPAATKACEMLSQVLTKIPSPLDALNPKKLPADCTQYWTALGKEPPQGLVGVLGIHRWRLFGPVGGLVRSPDKLFVAVSGGPGIHLINAETGAHQKILAAPGLISAFSPDGYLLASSDGPENDIRLHDAKTGAILAKLTGHTGPVWTLAFSPDSKTLYSSSEDKTVKCWNVEKKEVMFSIPALAVFDSVNCLAVRPDGKTIAFTAEKDVVELWDMEAKELVKSFAHPEVRSVAVSPDGELLATAGNDGNVKIWNAKSGEATATLKTKLPHLVLLTFSPDGQLLAAGSSSGQQRGNAAGIQLFETAAWQERALFNHENQITGMIFSHGSGTLFSTQYDSPLIQRWDVVSGKALPADKGPKGPIAMAAFLGDGGTLVSAEAGGNMHLWNVQKSAELANLSAHREGSALSASPDGKTLAWRDKTNMLCFRDVDAKKQSSVDTPGTLMSTSFSPDGKRLASLHADKLGLVLWDVPKNARLEHSKDDTRCAAFSPSGTELAVAFGEQMIYVLDAKTLKPLNEPRWPVTNGPVSHLVYSPDGRMLAGNGSELKLWDVVTGNERLTLPAGDPVFAPDGRTLAIAIKDRVCLYAVDKGSKVREWQFPGRVQGVAFAADGRHLATANGNGTVYILRLASAVP